MNQQRATCLWAAALLLVGVSACEGPARKPQPAESGPATQPAREPKEATVAERDTAQEQQAVPPPTPELPEWIDVEQRIEPGRPFKLQIDTNAPRRLAIDTQNVKRLRIDRAAVPLDTRRSIALLLDGQGIEWLADSDARVFERSVNGVWVPVKE